MKNLKNTSRTYLPKLQEKARQCKTKDELLELAADEDMEIPDDALEAVAGGCSSGGGEPMDAHEGGGLYLQK